MKKAVILVILLLIGGFLLYSRGERLIAKSIPTDTLIVFSQKKCPHCHNALGYIDETVRKTYPNLKIEVWDVAEGKNMTKLLVVAKKHRLNTKRLGTPVILLNDRIVTGWSEKQEKELSEIIRAFYAKNP